jgi:hypothetical protein
MAPEFLLGPPTPAQLARSGGYSFLDFKLLLSLIGGPAGCLEFFRAITIPWVGICPRGSRRWWRNAPRARKLVPNPLYQLHVL